MNEFDKKISDADKNICKSIACAEGDDLGYFSQNIVRALAPLVEAVILRTYSEVSPRDCSIEQYLQDAVKYIGSQARLIFLKRFYDCLQVSVSFDIPDEETAMRLVNRYLAWLFELREYAVEAFGLAILQNLQEYPLLKADSLKEYYQKIAEELKMVRHDDRYPRDRFYIQKSKVIFAAGKPFYELTLTPADDFSSKFDRFIAYSERKLPVFYAVKMSFIDREIGIIGRKMPIRLVNGFMVAIRPAELTNFARILGIFSVDVKAREYRNAMRFLTETGLSFTEVIDFDEEAYAAVMEKLDDEAHSDDLIQALDLCRALSQGEESGYHTIRYLLLKLRNKILRRQMNDTENEKLSYLRLHNKCCSFEEMPFGASLKEHNPPLYDVIASIGVEGHEDEWLARRVRINTEQNVRLFTPLSELGDAEEVKENMDPFNGRLREWHRDKRDLALYGDNIYISGYVNDTVQIITELLKKKGAGEESYSEDIAAWLNSTNGVDSAEKRAMLEGMFVSSNIALIYGAAGTGKTTLIKHIASFFEDEDKLFLANTNPAVDNLKRNIEAENSYFSTIASSWKALAGNSYKVIFVDECSTVDNRSMRDLLEQVRCDLLVLVGDIYQIQSIRFGNWFGLARYFLPESVIYELKEPFRSRNADLRELWRRVRALDPTVSDYLTAKGYSCSIDERLFDRPEDDEIILCLNYDGLYGINNVNRFMQNDNPSPPVAWDSWVYKVGDPVIFMENKRFYPVFYNNLKGVIREIEASLAKITFEVEVNRVIGEGEASSVGVEIVRPAEDGKTLVRFSVNRYIDYDRNEKDEEQVVPFQVAYAVSIHKAQGLEYDSVKIIITNESEERITHNIFYTAITRARKSLKIFWDSDTQEKVLGNMKMLSYERDAAILAAGPEWGLKRNSEP